MPNWIVVKHLTKTTLKIIVLQFQQLFIDLEVNLSGPQAGSLVKGQQVGQEPGHMIVTSTQNTTCAHQAQQ